MKEVIKNDRFQITVDTKGAQLCSVKTIDGTEYLWQGDPTYWREHAPNLFPYIARMTDKSYRYQGETYHMEIHGIAKYREFALEEKKADQLTFRLDSDEETLRSYPFPFTFRVIFHLLENRLDITYRITNKGERRMYYGVGGHPGFNVPNLDGTSFEDYYLEFEQGVKPTRVTFSPDCFVMEGKEETCDLVDGKLFLKHESFDQDAIVLKNAGHRVSVRCSKGDREIKVCFPDMPYIGFWHKPHTDAPYVCVEPWSSLPSRQGIVEDLEKQDNLCSLKAGETFDNNWSIEIVSGK